MKKSGSAKPFKKEVSGRLRVLQSFLSCLFYLSQEAEKEGFPYITTILKESISSIDMLSRGEPYKFVTNNVIDESLYEAMNFLHKLADLSPEERSDYMRVYDILRKTFHINETASSNQKGERIRLQ